MRRIIVIRRRKREEGRRVRVRVRVTSTHSGHMVLVGNGVVSGVVVFGHCASDVVVRVVGEWEMLASKDNPSLSR
jgi:hypothetical protein